MPGRGRGLVMSSDVSDVIVHVHNNNIFGNLPGNGVGVFGTCRFEWKALTISNV